MNTYQVLYVSKAKKEIDEQSIKEIVDQATTHNSKTGITGILLFRGGIFLQLLEGEKSKVDFLYKKISNDSRHEQVTQIFCLEKNEPLFENWSMGYHEVSDIDVSMINEFLSWNKLISAAKDLDNNIILYILNRFKNVLAKKAQT
jgi:hypothetical protein